MIGNNKLVLCQIPQISLKSHQTTSGLTPKKSKILLVLLLSVLGLLLVAQIKQKNQSLSVNSEQSIVASRIDLMRQEFDSPDGESVHDAFLKRIEGIESSFGKNVTHRVLESGIHAGDAAQGRYGIMPETAIDIAKKINNKATELGRYTEGVKMPEIKRLARISKDQVVAALADPTIERKLARLLAREVTIKQRGDERRMAEAWNKGSNLTYAALTDARLAKSVYVRKFDELHKVAVLKPLGEITIAEGMANWLAKN